ncbi:PREDICTED: proteoglycan 4 [Hipposideros armiger]|uniref:Proteoglycan 4 n=1 Tax=Hipposideros armiger TaxID=186990 RepID=A0A8B7QQC9_HIPAR|nr:PREDICTED: proteoglycan 4 [Hipposideros armiger]
MERKILPIYLLLLFSVSLIQQVSSQDLSSCAGRCGEGYSRDTPCNCDYNCQLYMECCPDFKRVCTVDLSCKGRCFESFERGRECDCDSQCKKYGKCCPDYDNFCEEVHSPTSPPSATTAPPPAGAPQAIKSTTKRSPKPPNKKKTKKVIESEEITEEHSVSENQESSSSSSSSSTIRKIKSSKNSAANRELKKKPKAKDDKKPAPKKKPTPEPPVADEAGSGLDDGDLKLTPTPDAPTTQRNKVTTTSTVTTVKTVDSKPSLPPNSETPKTTSSTTNMETTVETKETSVTNKQTSASATEKITSAKETRNAEKTSAKDFEATSEVPAKSTPEAETTTKPSAPTTPEELTPTTPEEPTPTTPKEPAPTTPKEPAPTTPKEAAPTTPKEATAVTTTQVSEVTESEVTTTAKDKTTEEGIHTTTEVTTATSKSTTKETATPAEEKTTESKTTSTTMQVTSTTTKDTATSSKITDKETTLAPKVTTTTKKTTTTTDESKNTSEATTDASEDTVTSSKVTTRQPPKPTKAPKTPTSTKKPNTTPKVRKPKPTPSPPKMTTSTVPTLNPASSQETMLQTAPRPTQAPNSETLEGNPENGEPGPAEGETPHVILRPHMLTPIVIPGSEVIVRAPNQGMGINPMLSDETDLCNGKPVDGLTTLRNGTLVAFRGHYFWLLNPFSPPSPPRRITEVWGIPSPIDTVFTRCNCEGKTFFFKDSQYWRFTNDVQDAGYPKQIAKGFGGLNGKIVAALSIAKYENRPESVYFFKRGGRVQQYTYKQEPVRKCTGRPAVHYPVFGEATQVRRRRFERAVGLPQTHTIRIHYTPIRVRYQDKGFLHNEVQVSSLWRGLPKVVTAAVTLPNIRKPDGYDYYAFSRDQYYNVDVPRRTARAVTTRSGQTLSNVWYNCP